MKIIVPAIVGTRVAGERLGGPLWSSCPPAPTRQGTWDDHKGPHSTLHRPRPYDLV